MTSMVHLISCMYCQCNFFKKKSVSFVQFTTDLELLFFFPFCIVHSCREIVVGTPYYL